MQTCKQLQHRVAVAGFQATKCVPYNGYDSGQVPDPEFTAGKQIPKNEREAREKDMDDYAEVHVVSEDEAEEARRQVMKDMVKKMTKAAKIAAKLTAAASAATIAEAKESASYDDLIFYDKVLITAVVTLLATAFVLSVMLVRRPSRETARRSVCTQSMVTYRRELTTPRFSLLAEREHGAWSD